jgi:cyclohexanone monooxygenase
VPNRNRPWAEAEWAGFKSRYREYRAQARESFLGVPVTGTGRPVLAEPPGDVRRLFMERWQAGGGMPFLGAYTDLLVSQDANDVVAEFMRDRIREIVADPAVAELLCPRGYPVGAKRLCQSDDYYAMFNRPNVSLVDIKSAPIESVYAAGVKTTSDSYDLDALVFATGFDALTGALLAMDIRGDGGLPLRSAWASGGQAYLGVAAAGFPNMFMITGPGSPAVFSNVVLSIEQHVEWVRDCIVWLRSQGARRSSRPSRRSPPGWITCRKWPTRRCSPGRTPGTWGRTSLASPGCSPRTWAGAGRFVPSVTRSRPPGTRGSRWAGRERRL